MTKAGKSFISSIDFIHSYRQLPFPAKILKNTVEMIANNEKRLPKGKIVVILCSDYKIQKLNNTYRAKNKPTDVLSFPLDYGGFLGEIYISLKRAKIQAKRYNWTYQEEVNRLFVHGFFHLAGYDHMTEDEQKRMEKKESRYI